MKKVLVTIVIAAGIILGAFMIFAGINSLAGTIAFRPELSGPRIPRDFTSGVLFGLVGIVFMTVASRLGLRHCPLVTNIIFVALGCLGGLLLGLTRIPLLRAASTASPQTLRFMAEQRSFAIGAYPDIYPGLVNEFPLYILGSAIPSILLGLGLLVTGILGIARRSWRANATTPQVQPMVED